MKSLLHFLIVIVGVGLLTGCTGDDTKIEADLRLRHKGADMPVWVRGNVASGKILLFLHGGPGDCSMCYRYYLKPVEEEFGVAYWDQRIAGSSSGVVDVQTLNYKQFLEDTELVVSLIRQQFPESKIYLMGHSFGVELGWQFITTGNNESQVEGFIAVNGIFSSYRWLDLMRDWVIREATIADHSEIKAFAEANVITPENITSYPWEKLYRYMYDLGGNPVSVYSDAGFVTNYVLASPNLTFAQFTHGKHFDQVVNTDALTFEKGSLLQNVTIPVGLFWGEKDGIVPYEMATETKAALTSTTAEIVTFSESWHEPFITENAKFVGSVIAFLRKN